MSTRCQIMVEGCDVLLYRHSDGYPVNRSKDGRKFGVIPDIAKFIGLFMSMRGKDPQYLAAQLMWWMIQKSKVESRQRRGEDGMRRIRSDDSRMFGLLGFGLDPIDQIHGDIAFFYIVKPDRICVYQRTQAFMEADIPKISDLELVSMYNLQGNRMRMRKIKAVPAEDPNTSAVGRATQL